MKPFLKWAGGKRQILKVLQEKVENLIENKNVTYYEPFLGGGSLFFSLARNNCIINDYNEEIINAYKVIRDNPQELILKLEKHKKKDSKDYFYKIRGQDREKNYKKMNPIDKAARTIYLNKTCFNGLYRVNSLGYFNTPRGRYVNPLICDRENIMEIYAFFKANPNIQILSGDFEQAVPNPKKGDVVYFDPPYDYEDGKGFVGYSAEGFSRNELLRLKKFCDQLINKGCKVLISNNKTEFVLDTFRDEGYQILYEINDIKTNRLINSVASNRSNKVPEVLIYGYKK